MTENIKIDGSERSPEIEFNFDTNSYHMKGESYPEDIAAFYGEIIASFGKHLSGLKGETVQFTFELIYFNSSTAKIVMGLFDMLDEAAEENAVTVTWYYEEDDDNMEEMGEEFGEDLEKATFVLKEVPAT